MAVVVAAAAAAADVPVAPKKLLVLDKTAATGAAKVLFLAKDRAITKGDGTDVEQIGIRLDLRWADGSAGGAFTIPPGTANGWVTNRPGLAKFVNPDAPDGPTQAKVALVKPGKLLKLVGKGLGDEPLDLLGAAAPAGGVYTTWCVANGGEEFCHCSELQGCVYKPVAHGAGAKLVCRKGSANETCRDGDGCCPPGCAPADDDDCGPATCLTDLGLTVRDDCAGLEWEKKETVPGSGADAANPHDVDNAYAWVGVCSVSDAVCQPTAAAESACRAQTPSALWASGGCNQCPAGEGTCAVSAFSAVFGATTTIWDFVGQLNDAAFAGHADWRLPTTAGSTLQPTGEPAEIESLVDPTAGACGGGSGPCIAPVFGPTADLFYWASSTDPADAGTGFIFALGPGDAGPALKEFVAYVRAVR